MENPRGRILLMRAAAEGRIDTGGAFQEHIDLCLGCRACETACPSGVQYGVLLEGAREAVDKERVASGKRSVLEASGRWLGFRVFLLEPGRIRLLARVLRFYQKSGLSQLVRRLHLLPERLQMMEALLPAISVGSSSDSQPGVAETETRGTVAFLPGCVQEAFFGNVNRATIDVLRRNGYRVVVPKGQSCCGAAPLHVGEGDLAREMARRNLDALGDDLTTVDAIISNAGGCGATLKEYEHLLAAEPDYAERAHLFAQKVQDICEFLANRLHVLPTQSIKKRVLYVDSCHLRHAQKVVQEPRDLLGAIPGVELVELDRPAMCCGSAGVYNILQREAADQVLQAKMTDVRAKVPELIVTTNPGCQMQMGYGVRKYGPEIPVMHLVELLAAGYGEE